MLDDYHLIEDGEIHEQVVFLLEHRPPRLHLVIAGRADPPPAVGPAARGGTSSSRSVPPTYDSAPTRPLRTSTESWDFS